METRDWSLVVFTVLTQAAVGTFLTLQVLQYLSRRRRAHEGGAPVPLVVVLAVLSAGLFAALLHLSTPLQAARAVVNFSSSWLSREIVFGSLFAALLGALAAQEWRAAGSASASPAVATWLPHLTAAAGIAFLCCQTAIYLLPAQPAWNSLATPAAFGGTALRLGILGVAAGLLVRGLAPGGDAARPGGSSGAVARNLSLADGNLTEPGMSSATVRGLVLAGVAALALEFFVLPLHLAELAGDASPAAAASAQRLTGNYGGVLLLRLGLLAAAAAALGGILAVIRGRSRSSAPRLAAALGCGAFDLVLVSEVCGRFLFYAMQVRVGI